MWWLWHCVLCPSPVAGAARECGPQHLHTADYTPISDGSVPLHPASCGQPIRPPIAPRHPAPPLPSGPSTGGRGYSTLPGQEHCLQQVSPPPPFPPPPPPPSAPLRPIHWRAGLLHTTRSGALPTAGLPPPLLPPPSPSSPAPPSLHYRVRRPTRP